MSPSRSSHEIHVENANEYGPFAADVIEELQQVLGVRFPVDYLTYLLSYNGGQPTPNFYWVVPDDWGSGIRELFGAQRNDLDFSLLRNLEWGGLPLKPGMFVIGGDGAFGYILMSLLAADFGSIHFCCTWSGDPNVYKGQGYRRIADSFADFLKRLEEPSNS